jgi:predicted P-loop ATPase
MTPEYEAWVERARAVLIEDELARRGIRLKGNGKAGRCGACPICQDGDDRFSINTKKQVWNCRKCGAGGDLINLVKRLDGCGFEGACETLTGEPPPRTNGHAGEQPKKVVVETYSYHDADGVLIYQTQRIQFRKPDGSFVLTKEGKPEKTFCQRRPDPQRPGKFIYNLDGVPNIPYRLPQVREAIDQGRIVAIVEGEAKADLLWSWGIAATCNSGGAEKWTATYAAFLKDADAVILGDNDEPGRKHVDKVGASLVGIAVRVRVLDLPDLPAKGDVLDWAKAGHTSDDLWKLVDTAEPWAMSNEGPFPSKPKTTDDWFSKIQRTDTGKVIQNLNNALLVLENDSAVSDRFSFNEMSRAIMVGRAIGGPPHPRRMATNIDVTDTQRWLQISGNIRISKEIVAQAMESRAMLSSYHPIRDYLTGLRWDNVCRLKTWLNQYLGAEASQYSSAIGEMFLISMVARIFKPGCKVDHMPVLEDSNQGTLKSAACRVLAGDEYFSDSIPDLETKDSSQHLRGKWLVEVAEMHAFDRAETARLKSYITRQEERYRPPYARFDVLEPRMCVFVGTTNKTAYLKDETGGRRFWPIKTRTIDIDALRQDRDQLFAEAVALFNNDTPWWPDAVFEREHIKPQQDDRYDADIWEEKVRDWTGLNTSFTIDQVAKGALFIDTPKVSKSDQLRIAAILENLGFKRQRAHGGKVWVR